MENPCVTIGLPVYNGQNFLREAIKSVLAQTFTDFELIIRDNCSTDETEEICKEFAIKDKRIRYFRNETNLGAGPNFNGIVSFAKGKYFKWMAHDDVIAPSFLGECVKILDSDSTAVLACSHLRFIDSEGRKIEDYVSPFPTWDANRLIRFSAMLGGHRCFEVFGLIRLNELLKTHNIGNFHRGDAVLLAHLALLGRFAVIPAYLFLSRRHENQSMYVFGITNPKGVRDFEAYANWFDSRNKVGISSSFNKMLGEYLWMIRTTPMPAAERVACYRMIAKWFLPRWRILAGEWKRKLLYSLGISGKQANKLQEKSAVQ